MTSATSAEGSRVFARRFQRETAHMTVSDSLSDSLMELGGLPSFTCGVSVIARRINRVFSMPARMDEAMSMIDIQRVNHLHRDTVERWHHQSIDNPYDGVWSIICKQHSFNFLLWHEEDVARSPDVSDTRIAEVKRAIDRYNQQRNDWIEKIDDWLTGYLLESRVAPNADATMNTETPGSVIDRLSILSLRLYHLVEQLDRSDVDQNHRDSVQGKIAVCAIQQDDLSKSLAQLLGDIQAGRKRHRTYRQFKMYNDPTLNPQLYQSKSRRAG